MKKLALLSVALAICNLYATEDTSEEPVETTEEVGVPCPEGEDC